MELPEIVEPALVILLDTITLMTLATAGGGSELLPGPVFHPAPQAGGFEADSANPLNADGAGPPLSEFDFAHFEPQNVTVLPDAALASPITNAPAWADGVASGNRPRATSYTPVPANTDAGLFGDRLPVRAAMSYIKRVLPAA
jgi:hypothetical protein